MQHRAWWPTAQDNTHSTPQPPSSHSLRRLTDVINGMTPSAFSAKVRSAPAVLQVDQFGTAHSVSTTSADPLFTPKDAEAEALDWQTTLLQKVLPRPKSTEPEAIPITASSSQQHSSAKLNTQPQRKGCNEAPQGLLYTFLPKQQSSSGTGTSSPALYYAGVFLDPLSRAKLLSWAQPMHSCLSADHMTLLFRPGLEAAEKLPLGCTVELPVLAKMHDAVTQVCVITTCQLL